MTSKGCAFLMDMGTGKTITTIALAGTLHHRHKITQMLVVCPKSIVDVWEQEFEKFADFLINWLYSMEPARRRPIPSDT